MATYATYASGEEPRLFDLVECIDFPDLSWLGTHRICEIVHPVNSVPMVKATRFKGMWVRLKYFRLVSRATAKEQP